MRLFTVLGAAALFAALAVPGLCDTKYTVREGDSVWVIARRLGLPYRTLLKANRLAEDSILRPGQRLSIPRAARAPARPARREQGRESVHVIQPGDSLWVIARRHGVSVHALAEANGLRPQAVLAIGRRLKIPGAARGRDQRAGASPRGHSAKRVHIVQRGDSLWAIARRHGTTVRALAEANGLDRESILRPGRPLTIPGAGREQQPPREAADKEPAGRVHVVAESDTLSAVAARYGTTVEALAQANGLETEAVLAVGQRLAVPGGEGGESPSEEAKGESPQRFVATALQYQGVRYRYGGMSTRGMDCSGLVARVLRTHGISAPHDSRALYGMGQPVSREELRPGDLVFFHTTRAGISHVGIYFGEGKFIHASSSKRQVRIDPLDTGYYARRYVGARRIP